MEPVMRFTTNSISLHLSTSRESRSGNNTPNRSASTSPTQSQSNIPSDAYSDLPTLRSSAMIPFNNAQSGTPPPLPLNSVWLSPFLETVEPLFNLNRLGIKEEDRQWFRAVNTEMRTFLCDMGTAYNYQHIRRIVSNAAHILRHEAKKQAWARQVDPLVVWVACMTRVVGDELHKREVRSREPLDIIDDFLKPLGCPLPIRRQAAYLAVRVAITPEVLDEESTKAFADAYPAFRVIEDAHRLDELGAIGVTRYIFGLYKSQYQSRNLTIFDIDVMEQIFESYPRAMKTETARKMAERRYKWMTSQFLGQWKVEVDTSNV